MTEIDVNQSLGWVRDRSFRKGSEMHENPTLFGDFPGSQVHIREAVVDKKVPKNR